MLRDRGELSEAAEHFRATLRLAPNAPNVHRHLADLLFNTGERVASAVRISVQDTGAGIAPDNRASPPRWVGTLTLDHLGEVSVVEPAFWQELATSVGISSFPVASRSSSRCSGHGSTCLATKSIPSSVRSSRTAEENGHHSAW